MQIFFQKKIKIICFSPKMSKNDTKNTIAVSQKLSKIIKNLLLSEFSRVIFDIYCNQKRATFARAILGKRHKTPFYG